MDQFYAALWTYFAPPLTPKHLQRYVDEFSGRHGVREDDTITQMQNIVTGMVGKRLMYRELVAD